MLLPWQTIGTAKAIDTAVAIFVKISLLRGLGVGGGCQNLPQPVAAIGEPLADVSNN